MMLICTNSYQNDPRILAFICPKKTYKNKQRIKVMKDPKKILALTCICPKETYKNKQSIKVMKLLEIENNNPTYMCRLS